ncbi:copper-exporting P-type ATPase CopA [Sesbania bispinosa]|nr:copper-exporting P-type ATPase CopA [Sesbania bispinosa]
MVEGVKGHQYRWRWRVLSDGVSDRGCWATSDGGGCLGSGAGGIYQMPVVTMVEGLPGFL